MLKKRFLQFTAIVLMFMLCLTIVVNAAESAYFYAPGPREYELDRTYFLKSENASLEGNELVFKAGGSMTFDLLMPFESDKLELTYDELSSPVNLNVTTDDNEYKLNLQAKTTSQTVAIGEVYGSTTITIKSDGKIKITGFKFHKLMELTLEIASKTVLPELSEYEEALQNAVVVDYKASALKSRGAFRKYDFEDSSVIPQIVDGVMYVPLDILSVELKLYKEDYPEKSYILLRDDKYELALIKGKGYFMTPKGEKTDVEMNVFYEKGKTWVPLRKLSELFGFYVEYRDGCAVIDDRLVAKKIVTDDEIFSQLKAEMSEYISEKEIGKVYHVSKTAVASDANSGTEKYPFKTIEKAAKIAKAGDTVIIHEGTYREVLRPENNGTKASPIIFKAADGENVTISALEPVTQFVKYDENIYCAALTKDLGDGRNQLFYLGEGLEEGRHPNSDTKPNVYPYPEDVPDKYYATKGNIAVRDPEGSIAYSDTDLNQPAGYWNGGVFVTLKGHGWSLVSGDIVSSEPGRLNLKDHDGTMSYNLGITQGSWFNQLYNNTTTKYYMRSYPDVDWGYITNHLNTVDIPGEWYIGDKKIYLYPPEGSDLSKDFEIKARQLVIDLRDRQHVVIQNINTIGGGMTMYGETEGVVLDGGTHKYISHFTKCIDNQKGFINEGDTRLKPGAIQAGEVGFCMGGKNNSIINTTIEWSPGAGIYATGEYHMISNNVVAHTSYMGTYPGGITIANELWEEGYPGGHTITNNTVYNAGRSVFLYALSPGLGDSDAACVPAKASEIAYNYFYNGSLMSRDTGVTYEYSTYHGNDAIRTTMHHNYVGNLGYWDEVTDAMLFQIYHDGYIEGRSTYNNLTFYSNDITPEDGVFENRPWTKVRRWQNTQLGHFEKGLEGLTEGDFPCGKPFIAGAVKEGDTRYMVNYNNIVSGKSPVTYVTSIDESSEKNVYKFEDVYFKGDCYNRMTINYKRPAELDTMLNFKIKITGETDTFDNTASVWHEDDEWWVDAISTGYTFVPPMAEGYYDVSIEVPDDKTEIYGVITSETTEEFKDTANPSVIFGATYDEAIQGGKASGALSKTGTSMLDKIKTGAWATMWNTWSHTGVFKDRTVHEPAKAVELLYATHANYAGQRLRIYVDSMDTEPIVDTRIIGDHWSTVSRTVELTRTLEPGTYTFYVDFKGSTASDDEPGCCNFHYFKFLSEMPEEVSAE